MQLAVVLLVAAISVFTPRASDGAPVVFVGGADTDGFGFDFGTLGANIEGRFETVLVNGTEIVLPDPGLFVTGDFELSAGPRVSLSITSDGERTYSRSVYGPGHVSLVAEWIRRNGSIGHGTLSGVLREVTIELCEQELTGDEFDCGDVFGESHGFASVSLGPGLFDRSLAKVLGVRRQVFDGDWSLFIDGVSGSPDSTFRVAGSAGGTAGDVSVTARDLPEPALTALLVSSLLIGVARRRS